MSSLNEHSHAYSARGSLLQEEGDPDELSKNKRLSRRVLSPQRPLHVYKKGRIVPLFPNLELVFNVNSRFFFNT